ncbi:hypothetical protein N0V95_002505 [Ascochyta clinopodiicola]|nr:hypothetical protein N0V95_002505 [Ascochyta clinopodiicola]
MPFESLPAEIQIEIFSYLQGSSLKAVRRVCRAFRDHAEPTLFRYVIATARYQSLGAFQKISLFPVFQKHVREIVFDGSVWKRYQQLFKEQEEMKSDGILVHTISKALEWMPNVSCITYSPQPRHLPAEAKELRDLIPRGVTALPTAGYTSSDHPFRQLVAALYMSQFTGIREFRTNALGATPGTEFALDIFNLTDDSDMAAGKFLFQHLETLVLNMALRIPDQHLFGETLDKFAELLNTSSSLKHLHLHPTHWTSEFGVRPLFARFGLQNTWPRLQSLSLKGMLADEEEFSGMIKRHKETLVSVRFIRCSLLAGSWADIVDEVVYGSKIYPFVLDRVNEIGLPNLNYASLSASEIERWKYEGRTKVTRDGDRNFVSATIVRS